MKKTIKIFMMSLILLSGTGINSLIITGEEMNFQNIENSKAYEEDTLTEDIGFISGPTFYDYGMNDYLNPFISQEHGVLLPTIFNIDANDGWKLYGQLSSSSTNVENTVSFNINENYAAPGITTFLGSITDKNGKILIAEAQPGMGMYEQIIMLKTTIGMDGSRKDVVGVHQIILELMLETPNNTSIATSAFITLAIIDDTPEYTVSFNSMGGTSVASQTVYENEVAEVPSAPKKEGYNFIGWSKYEDEMVPYIFTNPVTENIELYAGWTANEYTISYDLAGGDNNLSNPTKYMYGKGVASFENPSRLGHTFKGWYDATTGNLVTHISSTDSGNKELVAKWDVNKYSITYDLDGGTNDSKNPQEYTYGIGVTKFENPIKKGYTFLGWEDVDKKPITFISITDSGNKTIKAIWKSNSYDISYDLDGGTNDSKNPQEYIYGIGVTNFEPAIKDGYIFLGWYDASGNVISEISPTVIGDITLYAEWRQLYKVSFDSRGGTMIPTQIVEEGALIIEPSDPVLEGYTFNGWFTSPVTRTTPVIWDFAKDTVKVNLTLYAHWTQDDTSDNTTDASPDNVLPTTGENFNEQIGFGLVSFVTSILLIIVWRRITSSR